MAAVGPITAGPLERAGLAPVIAERGRLGIARAHRRHALRRRARAVAATRPRGASSCASAGAVLDGRFIPLSRTGIELLGVLFDAHGAVVSRQSLQCALPRSGDNTHAVEMAVARVREALGVPDLIKTVVKRGYRLNVLDPGGDGDPP